MTVTAFKYEMGLRAKDHITEFEGIIVSRVDYLFGCSQYGLVPKKNADGTVAKTEYFDEARIEVVDNGVRREGPQDNEFKDIFMHEAGQEAKDKVTGFEGKIVYRIEYLNGCNQYGLIPTIDKDGKARDAEQFDEGRIEIIGKGIPAKEVRVEKRGALINRDAPKR
jgi:hypothetical protein